MSGGFWMQAAIWCLIFSPVCLAPLFGVWLDSRFCRQERAADRAAERAAWEAGRPYREYRTASRDLDQYLRMERALADLGSPGASQFAAEADRCRERLALLRTQIEETRAA